MSDASSVLSMAVPPTETPVSVAETGAVVSTYAESAAEAYDVFPAASTALSEIELSPLLHDTEPVHDSLPFVIEIQFALFFSSSLEALSVVKYTAATPLAPPVYDEAESVSDEAALIDSIAVLYHAALPDVYAEAVVIEELPIDGALVSTVTVLVMVAVFPAISAATMEKTCVPSAISPVPVPGVYV